MNKKQPYIYSPFADIAFILSPPFICLAIVFILYPYFNTTIEVEPYQWLILVLCIDVSHVYSTLYRTYFDPYMLKNQRTLLIAVPLLTGIAGFSLHLYNDLWFWRILAYLAVFHFVRQQYGIFRIYSRNEDVGKYHRRIGNIAIYASTLYPIIMWHISGEKNFTWFVHNDFFYFNLSELKPLFSVIYIIILLLYFSLELYHSIKQKILNFPKNLILIGTGLSWYYAIVFFNSDLVFTFLNVVSHGIPYMALIWMYGTKKLSTDSVSSLQKLVFTPKGLLVFVSILLGLAFIEEFIWDSLIWHDYPQYFNFSQIWGIGLNTTLKTVFVALLTIPQVTHYILDGFIWRKTKMDS